MFRNRPILRILFLHYYCIAVVGAPIPVAYSADPVAAPATSTQQRFPCEDGACGCTFDRCWTDCCCHNLRQRLAWARKHRVRPPQAALEAAKLAKIDITIWVCDDSSTGCPAQGENTDKTQGNCETEQPPTNDCCGHRRTVSTDHEDQKSVTSPQVILLVQAMSCRGLAQAWSAIPAGPLPTPLAILGASVDRPISLATASIPILDPSTPPTPPPRNARFV